MRVSKVDWVMHSNMPILSIDAQPNGFRFVTGGTDHKVCIWNLLPVISTQYEKQGAKKPTKYARENEEVKRPANADVEMKEDPKPEDSNDEEEESYDYDAQNGYKDDIELMKTLFESEKKRSQRLLAVLDQHSNPVNCVRWNNIGTLFASAADDGSVLLWEYVGETIASSFQRYQHQASNVSGGLKKGGFLDKQSFQEGQEVEGQSQEQPQIMEEWRSKKSWRGHKGGVSDLAWCPDNIHFASCGTDSQIIIWNINEQSAIKHLDQKANGLTFDPFGKFMASQSSEDRSLIIWRIQDFKNLTKECEHQSFYKEAMSQSLFRRLSWSSDGQFISTTAGKIGKHHLAPLIERSSWKQLATLSGHNKTITTSRINPKLFKEKKGQNSADGSSSALSCYSVVALASIDSTISIWKPYLEKPFAVIMDIFKMGITDLSWGFNGNLLLASSNDGKIFMMHFKPGSLGSPITELEKQLIIEKRYGATILNDYKKHTKVTGSGGINQIASNAIVHSQQVNLTGNQVKEQQKETVINNAKKKIVPVMVKQYNESSNINPFLNPFQNQMIVDQSTVNLQQPSKPQEEPQIIQPQIIQKAVSTLKPPTTDQLQKAQEQPKLPPFSQAFGNAISSTSHSFQQQKSQQSFTQNDIPLSTNLQKIQSPVSTIKTTQNNQQQQQQPQIQKPTGQQQQQLQQIQQQQMQVPQAQQEDEGSQVEMSGKKTKKAKRKKIALENNESAFNQNLLAAGSGGAISSGQLMNKELLLRFERVLETAKENIQTMTMEQYQKLQSVVDKESIQVNLPASDAFSDEIRVFITNIDLNAFNRRADIKIFNSENMEVSHTSIEREIVILTSVNSSFFVLYTNQGQIVIYSSRTTRLVKNGLIQEGICFLDSSSESMQFAVLTLKGLLSVYKVKSPDYPSVDSCSLLWTASVTDILRTRMHQIMQQREEDNQEVSVIVEYIKLMKDGSVTVFLSDESIYEFDLQSKMWRQIDSSLKASLKASSQSQHKELGNRDQIGGRSLQVQSPSEIINLLEQQQAQDSESGNLMMTDSFQHPNKDSHPMLQVKNPFSIESQLDKLGSIQESLLMFERLQMKKEFLQALRMYTGLVIANGDFIKLKDLILDYRFLTNWEEEQQLGSNQESNQKQYTLHGQQINIESAFSNLIALIQDQEEDDLMKINASGNQGLMPLTSEKQKVIRVDFKRYFQICGMEKKEVFQKAIMPAIKTLVHINSDFKEILSIILKMIIDLNSVPSTVPQHSITQTNQEPPLVVSQTSEQSSLAQNINNASSSLNIGFFQQQQLLAHQLPQPNSFGLVVPPNMESYNYYMGGGDLQQMLLNQQQNQQQWSFLEMQQQQQNTNNTGNKNDQMIASLGNQMINQDKQLR